MGEQCGLFGFDEDALQKIDLATLDVRTTQDVCVEAGLHNLAVFFGDAWQALGCQFVFTIKAADAARTRLPNSSAPQDVCVCEAFLQLQDGTADRAAATRRRRFSSD
ncbi:hypothetical protein AB7008_09515 [Bradyrhizobium sp. 521_C7_N1_3]|uniref:hypothetical protein n=1 Tax=Bradyrhizobium sp. 521_C7_N1_3 TaxID=3240368 RepID=UPI003F8C366C